MPRQGVDGKLSRACRQGVPAASLAAGTAWGQRRHGASIHCIRRGWGVCAELWVFACRLYRPPSQSPSLSSKNTSQTTSKSLPISKASVSQVCSAPLSTTPLRTSSHRILGQTCVVAKEMTACRPGMLAHAGPLTRPHVAPRPPTHTQHTTHNTQHTTHNTQHTTHNTQHTCTHNVLRLLAL